MEYALTLSKFWKAKHFSHRKRMLDFSSLFSLVLQLAYVTVDGFEFL
jgi:hypothetical protein